MHFHSYVLTESILLKVGPPLEKLSGSAPEWGVKTLIKVSFPHSIIDLKGFFNIWMYVFSTIFLLFQPIAQIPKHDIFIVVGEINV